MQKKNVNDLDKCPFLHKFTSAMLENRVLKFKSEAGSEIRVWVLLLSNSRRVRNIFIALKMVVTDSFKAFFMTEN